MNKIFELIDRLWGIVSENVFVRFDFALPIETLRTYKETGRLVFASPYGGFIEWLILSSWCRRQGFGAILVANRKRILMFSKPLYFLQVLFRQKSYAELFLNSEPGPRIFFCPTRDRRQPNEATPAEKVLSELYTKAGPQEIQKLHLVPFFIRWRKYIRGDRRTPSEYLFGLSSNPNLIGKVWYLLRKRFDSTVTSLPEIVMSSKESGDTSSGDETEALRIAKTTRRKILIGVAQEMHVALGPRYHSPVEVKEVLLKDPQILQVIEEVSKEKGIEKKKLMMVAYQILTEIAANYRLRFIEVMNVLLQWLFTKVFDGLVTDEKELQSVRELMKGKSVVFVSSHRSHLDYLVVPYLLFHQDMVTPHIAAGVNLSFWPIGTFLRFGGAFFIRRSFRGDKLYSVCLRKYVEYLLKNRFNIKFFIEGTRSRSGKMLPPTYGFLKMVMETYEKKGVDDIALLPTSMCYDEVLEEGSYTKELTGGKKEQESAKGFLQSRKYFKKNIGKVYVHFGPPLFTREIYQQAESLGQDASLRLQKTAFEISKRINDATPVTPKAIVSATLLGSASPAIPLEELLSLALGLGNYVSATGGFLSVSGDGLRRAIEQTLRKLQKGGIVSATADSPKKFYCHPRYRILLNFYKNNGMHSFVSLSLISLGLITTESSKNDSDLFKRILEVRNILKFEFFFSPTPVFLNEMKKVLEFVRASGVAKDTKVLKTHARLVGDVFESYLNAFLFIKESSGSTFEKKILLAKILKVSETKLLEGNLLFPESLSTQSYSGALSLLENLGVVSTEEKQMVRVNSWSEEALAMEEQLKQLLEMIRVE